MATYLITQATGQQSLWTIQFLLSAGAKVHALVRDPSKLPSSLIHPNITIFPRENDSPAALLKAAQGTKGVFINTWPGNGFIESEGQQAALVLEAAKQVGVKSVVVSTSFFTGNKEMWSSPESFKLVGSYYQSKEILENTVRESGLSYTILRPAFICGDYIFPNVTHNFPALPKTGTLEHGYAEGKGILHIDERDIGAYASAALLNPEKFAREEIELGNEYLTLEDVQGVLGKVTGKRVGLKRWSEKETRETNEWLFTVRFFLWSNLVEMRSRAEENEWRFGIRLGSFEEFVEREKGRVVECLERGGL